MEVFISFIHEEKDVAAAVAALLQDKLPDKEVFLAGDEWTVYAGEIWLDRIRTELTSAKVVVSLLSQKSLSRPWINFEAGAAWLRGTPVIPACFGGVSKGSLPHPYSSMQALDLRTDCYYLVTSVAKYLNAFPPAPTPPSKRDEGVLGYFFSELDDYEKKLAAEKPTASHVGA